MENDNLKNSNLNYLQNIDYELYSFYKENLKSIDKNFKYQKGRKTGYSFYCNYLKKYITSPINPLKEAERKINDFIKKNTIKSNIILFELLAGDELIILNQKLNKKIRIYITIYSLELFDLSLEIIDFKKIYNLSNLDIVFLFGKTEQEFFIRLKEKKNINIFIRYNLIEIYKELYTEYSKSFDYFLLFKPDKSFEKKFDNIIKQNIEKNYELLKNIKGISNLEVDISKKALLVGAGPSLDNNLEKIYLNRKEYIVFSTDTSLPILIENNIIPDIVVSIDAQKLSYEYFKNNLNYNYILVVVPYTYPKIITEFKGKKYLMLPDKHYALKDYNFSFLTKQDMILGGGSVSIYLLDLIIKLGFKQVDITGQDFGWTNNYIYSKYSLYYKKILANLNKFNTIETDFYNAIVNKNAFWDDTKWTLKNLKTYYYEFISKIQKSDLEYKMIG